MTEYRVEYTLGIGVWHPLPSTHHAVDQAIGAAKNLIRRAAEDEEGLETLKSVRVTVVDGVGIPYWAAVPRPGDV